MKISAKLDYACRAVLELSIHWPKPEPLPITVISDRRKIPLKFLTQILLSLKQLGVVESVRGKDGGYLLTRSPKEIHLSEVLKHFEDWNDVANVKNDAIKGVWADMDQAILDFAGRITFEELIRREQDNQKVPAYAI